MGWMERTTHRFFVRRTRSGRTGQGRSCNRRNAGPRSGLGPIPRQILRLRAIVSRLRYGNGVHVPLGGRLPRKGAGRPARHGRFPRDPVSRPALWMEPGRAEAAMMDLSGARQGLLRGFRGLVPGAMAWDLRAFVVPGEDVANALGLDLDAAGLIRVATPRHASVLLIAGPLPPALVDATSVVWAQMPRPRCILALGSVDLGPLPAPDVTAEVSQQGLISGLEDLRKLIRNGATVRNI